MHFTAHPLPSVDFKSIKMKKTQGHGEEWVGVVMSQLNPRIGELGASVLNSRVEPVVQVPFSTVG